MEEKRETNISSSKPANHGLRWTEQEKSRLFDGFKGGADLKELAKEFERTLQAIAKQLYEAGLIDEGHYLNAKQS
jgi:hypothetical protein